MKVIQAFPGGVFSREQVAAFEAFEAAFLSAIADAKGAGVPQGLIVAILHGHATRETLMMTERL